MNHDEPVRKLAVALFFVVGCSANASPDRSAVTSTSSAISEPRNVVFEIGAFIPCEGLNGAVGIGLFDGDNRVWFDGNGNPHSAFGFDFYRNRVALRTTVTSGGAVDEPFIHESVRYDQGSGSYSTLGYPLDWCTTMDPNNPPAVTQRGTASIDGIHSDVLGWHIPVPDGDEPGATSKTALTLYAKGPNGAADLPSWAVPPIDVSCDVDIYYRPDDDGTEQPIRIDYACLTTHFPSVEVYISGHPVLRQDVLAEGRNPFELGSPDRGGNVGTCRWNDGWQTWSCDDT